MKGVRYPKSSLYLEPPKAVATEIIRWTRKNIYDNEIYSGPPDQPGGRENQIHITTLYGIIGNQGDAIEQVLRDIAPVDIALGPIDLFITSIAYDVVVVQVISESLRALNKRLREHVTYEDRYPDFNPHLTLAFTKKNCCWRYYGKVPFEETFVCDTAVFSKDGFKHRLKIGGS